jgi:hypothetical protein
MSVPEALRVLLLGRDDPRAESEIGEEIRDELRFHLEMGTRDGVAAGLEPEEARRDAERRFGSFEAAYRGCLRARKGGRIMLQRINLVVGVLLLAAVGVLGWQWWEGRRQAAAEMAGMRGEIAEVLRRINRETPAVPDGARIHVLGRIQGGARSFAYREHMTLGQAIAIAGGFDRFAQTAKLVVIRKAKATVVDFDEVIAGEREDFALEAEDLVYVPEALF